MSNYNNDTIERFALDGTPSLFANSGLSGPEGVAFDSAGYLYAANAFTNTIVKFSPGGTVFADTLLDFPHAIAFDSSGNLYAASGNSTIAKYTPSGEASLFATTGLDNPNGLAFDSAGNLYAANRDNNTIVRFAPDGSESPFASSGLNFPHGLVFDTAGNLYVANGNDTILKFDPQGVGSVFATNAGAFGLAFDDAGNLYAAEFIDNRIEKFAPNGDRSIFATTGLSTPLFIAIGPDVVPEPSLAGLVFMLSGVAVARRRR